MFEKTLPTGDLDVDRGIDTDIASLAVWRCSLDLRLQYGEGSHHSVEDDSADLNATTGTFTPRLGAGREMPSFFIL
jgi:hypothetical protein